jgi:hypothetical protein
MLHHATTFFTDTYMKNFTGSAQQFLTQQQLPLVVVSYLQQQFFLFLLMGLEWAIACMCMQT